MKALLEISVSLGRAPMTAQVMVPAIPRTQALANVVQDMAAKTVAKS